MRPAPDQGPRTRPVSYLARMRTRGPVAALVAIAVLGGCASFADDLRETSREARAEASSTSSSASATTSASASASASRSATTSSSAATTTATPGPAASTTPAATTPPPAPVPPPANGPDEIRAAYGTEPWGVYLSAAQDYSAAERSRMEAVHRDLQALGYEGFIGTLCDEGAEAAGVDPYGDAVSIYFRSRAEAEQFLALWNRPSVGYAKVLIVCGD